MYAIVETGGKQFQVEPNAKIVVEKLNAKPGDEITLERVLLLGGMEADGEASCRIGAPTVEGASVVCEVAAQARMPKVIVFKRRRRKDSKTMHGHRQDCTCLLVKQINI